MPDFLLILFSDATRVLFEVTDLSSASPSVVAQCPLVCVDAATVGWRSIWETWGTMAKQRWVINTTWCVVLLH